ncbi:VPA1262 family protein [Burkholderia pyrrocinia]|uniref:VPA1262 family protein n=1 Tax=Burkholderia pyrrocinia TaxID=60550 RepID=UPI0005523BEB|nr:VPA1262 family protein [Burkholderia pyrrocinia]
MTTELKDLIDDARLGRLFATPRRACALQIWIAQIQTDDGIENRFVYGRLLPYSFHSEKWSASSDERFEAFNGYRAQVILATLYIGSDQTGELLIRLSKGGDIKEVSGALGLNLPELLERRIGAFSLRDCYTYRPVALLLNRDAHENVGLQSPHGSASAFSAAITTVDKERLFTTARGLDPDMARFLIKRMNADTGLDFAGNDATRFGDLELLVFPTLDDHERELLDISWADERKALVIELNLMQLPGFSTFFVHSQIMNNGQRVFSRVMAVDNGASDVVKCRFELPDGLGDIADSTEVEIHGMKDGDAAATFCCNWKIHYVREINISGRAVGHASGEVKLGWLDKALKKNLRGSARVAAAQSVNRGADGFVSTVGGRQADPWVTANRKVSELLGVLHPKKSEARFFGRLSEGDGTERLQFVEWIKQQFAKYRDHQIIFFDPYFEDAGIGMFVPNASDKGEYVVFTTVPPTKPSTRAQKPALGDDPDSNRVDNLLASCKQLQGLVQRIDLKIFGVKPGALHDRYMLVADRRGLPVAGFNLSNSIQKANEDHPLLITPIPMDALHEVFSYAARLISRAANGSRDDDEDIAPIFDSKRQEQPARKQVERLDFLRRHFAGKVLSTWTGNDSLRDLHGGDLRVRLAELGLLDGESLRVPHVPGLDACIGGLNASDDASQEQWGIVAEILAHTQHGNSRWDAVGVHNRAFIDFLAGSLDGVFSRISNVAPDTSFASVSPHLFLQDLEGFLRGSYSHEHFHYRIKYQTLTWSDVYSVKILWSAAPEKLMKLSERYAVTLDQGAHHRDAIKLSLLSQIVGEVSLSIVFGISDEQRESLLKSTNGLLKWMGLASLRDTAKTLEGAKQVVERLALLGPREGNRVMCWLLSSLARKQGNEESFGIVRQALYNALPLKLTENDAEFLVDSLRGHMSELGWSEPWLFAEVIVPLIEDGRITSSELSGIWMKELSSYLDRRLLGETINFDRSREGRVTEVAAFLFARCHFEDQGKAIENLLKILKKARANVQKPLASTMNWNKWDCSLEVAMWIYAFCRYVEHYMEESAVLPTQFVDLCQPSREVAMIRTLDEWRYSGVRQGAFVAFIEEVGEI